MKLHNACLMLVLVGAGLLLVAQVSCNQLERWLGPSAVELGEAYADGAEGPRVDHGTFGSVLQRFVTEAGSVRYEALVADSEDLDRYIAELGKVEFAPLPRDEKLALLINAYNAFTLRLIADYWPLTSIRDIPSSERWAAQRWRIGALQLSLEQIENEYLRGRFVEPRIHFAINCASIGCPPLRREAYEGQRIEQQLQAQSIRLHADPVHVDLHKDSNTIRLTRLYLWFEGDFEQVSGSVLTFAARFHAGLEAELASGVPDIEWIEYDWRLNLAR